MSDSNSFDTPVVLVVDDEALLRLLATDVLEEGGYRVLEAADAASALNVLAEHKEVGVLFTDVNMPGLLDGMDLAREVHRRWPDVKLLITSGRMRPVKEDIPDSGRFVPKPYSPQTLLQEVRTVIAH